jgi:NAD(P)-dependent dehydrogenase (short-subunit alcohol dehydrogenase family)
MRLQGKTAAITGSGAGIGRAAAVMFAREGASVAIIDIDEAAGRETQSTLEAAGASASFFPCDVSSPPAVESTVQLIVDSFGGLDVLYNNAGGGARASQGSVSDVDLEHWWDPFRLDLYGTFLCCRYCIPHLVAGGNGAIVNTVSANAFRPPVLLPAYSAAKAGIIAMTKALAVELGPQGVRVNAVSPGFTQTARALKFVDGQTALLEGVREKHLLDFGEPEDVAAAALFLASAEAKRVTGVVLAVDSGLTL